VNEVRVQEIRLLGPDCSDHVAHHPQADVRPAADVTVRDAQHVKGLVEPWGVAFRYVEPEEARVDPSLAQGWEQSQEVPLGSTHTGQLVEVQDLHSSNRR
jgi:hypothetical protein